MDSAYLKNHVGGLLAKGIAETVTAQPSNPQEYLALFLLHQLQEEERRAQAAALKRKANEMQESWSQQQAQREKTAADTIQRGFRCFQARLRVKQAAEEELREAYEMAEAEAEELLDQEAALKEGRGGGEDEAGEDAAGSGNDTAARAAQKLEAQQSALEEARGSFFRAQRFLLGLSKTAVGQLKHELEETAEWIRMAQDATLSAYHRAAAQEAALIEAQTAPSLANAAPELSPAAAALAERMADHRDHRFISVPYVNFLLFRCVCYLLLNATPKATRTVAQVAALIKPSVLVQHLRAFNPVAAYDRGVALKLERLVPDLTATAEGEDGDGDGDGAGRAKPRDSAPAADAPSVPFAQPTTRQIRRAARVLRTCWLDGEYLCEVDPEEYYTEEMIEEDSAKAATEDTDAAATAAVDPLIPTLQREVQQATQCRERAAEVRAAVEAQTKQRGGIVMYGLLRFITAAVAYRQARDAVAQQRRDMGLPVDSTEELPEDEAEDPLNEEVLVDEETGEADAVAIHALQERIGIDTEEALAKTWEARDARQREAYAMKALSLQRELDAGGDDEEEEDDA